MSHDSNSISSNEDDIVVYLQDHVGERPQDFSDPGLTDPSLTLVKLFAQQAARSSNNLAVVYKDASLTYEKLDSESSRCASILRDQFGIMKGSIVGVMLDRSELSVIAILGILKCGGVYLPIDPAYPKSRRSLMISDASLAVLITQSDFIFDLPYYGGSMFAIDVQLQGKDSSAFEDDRTISPDDPAYIIYTSGSTGEPKGVIIDHAGIANTICSQKKIFEVNEYDRHLQYASLSFDASISEIFVALLSGGTLYIIDDDAKKDPQQLADFIEENQIHIATLPPAFYKLVTPKRLRSLKKLITAGERASTDDALGFVSQGKYFNAYGPTEASICASIFCLEAGWASTTGEVPIGIPIHNNTIYILDGQSRLIQPNADGEICIGGAGVSRGYLNKPELTAEKFVRHPDIPGEILYRSGDLGMLLEDGNIEFRGRLDNQVKVRGHRVELGEIERTLAKHPLVDSVVVLLKSGNVNSQTLVAYCVSRLTVAAEELRAFLMENLPSYMIPSQFVMLSQLPLTISGKVDVKILLSMGDPDEPPEQPLGKDELRMVQVWRDVLSVESISMSKNFFAQGGDSIKAIKLTYDINEVFGTDFKLVDIYTYDTPQKIIARIREHQCSIGDNDVRLGIQADIEQLKVSYINKAADNNFIEDVYPVADIQLGMLYHGFYGESIYHDQTVRQVRYRDFDAARFKVALTLLTAKHESLRTGFNLQVPDSPVQIVYSFADVDYEHTDLSSNSQEVQEDTIRQVLAADKRQPFNIEKAGLWRIRTFSLGNDILVVLIVCHHAIMDGWSDAVFATELNNLYIQLKEEPFFVPEKLDCSYKDYVVEELASKQNEAIREFWKNELSSVYKTKFVFSLGDEQATTREYTLELGPMLKHQLVKFSQENDMSIRAICFSIYLQIIKSLAIQNEVVVGLHTHNRPIAKDGDKLLGCFLNSIPVKCTINDQLTRIDHLKKIHEKLTYLSAFSTLSLVEIVKVAAPPKRPSDTNPLFDTLFAYLDFHVYNNLNSDVNVESAFNNMTLTVSGQGVNNTFFNFLVHSTSDSLLLSISYKSIQIDEEMIAYIAGRFKEGLSRMISHPNESIVENDKGPKSVVSDISFNL